jgi:hypothetical protein
MAFGQFRDNDVPGTFDRSGMLMSLTDIAQPTGGPADNAAGQGTISQARQEVRIATSAPAGRDFLKWSRW